MAQHLLSLKRAFGDPRLDGARIDALGELDRPLERHSCVRPYGSICPSAPSRQSSNR